MHVQSTDSRSSSNNCIKRDKSVTKVKGKGIRIRTGSRLHWTFWKKVRLISWYIRKLLSRIVYSGEEKEIRRRISESVRGYRNIIMK